MADASTTGTQNPTDENPYALDKINPADLPEEMQPIYQSMLTDYRGKTTAAAEIRKEAEEIQRRNAELEAYAQQQQQSLQQYAAYYEQANPLLQQYLAQQQQGQPQADDAADGGYMDTDELAKKLEVRFAQVEQQQQLQAQQLAQAYNQVTAVLGLQEQLGTLRNAHGDLDPTRVFETAKQLNTPNLDAARKLAYYDEDREAYATQKAQEREEAVRQELAQQHANSSVLPGSPGGAFPVQQRTVVQPIEGVSGRVGWNRAREAVATALGQLPQ